jgi:hypothetical protein
VIAAGIKRNVDNNTRQRMDALRNTQAGQVFKEFLQAELVEAQSDFIKCTKDTFEQNKGRVLGLQKLINYLNSK